MIGQNVNNFEVRDLIGQGETGWVYLALHPIIGRKAALKVLRREFCQDETTDRALHARRPRRKCAGSPEFRRVLWTWGDCRTDCLIC